MSFSAAKMQGSSLTCFEFLKSRKQLSRFAENTQDQLFAKESHYDTEESSLSLSLNSIPSNEDWDCEGETSRDHSFDLFRPDDVYDSLFLDFDGKAVNGTSPRVAIPPRAIHIETIQQTHSTDSYDGETSVQSIPSPSSASSSLSASAATLGSSHYNGRTMESRYVSMPRSTPAAASLAASKVVAALSQRPVLEKSNSGGSIQFSPSALEDINIFVVAFKSLSKDFILGSNVPQGDQISVGDPVIVSVEAGEDLGYVTHMMSFSEFMLERFQSPFVPTHFNINRFVGQIIRIATPRECRMLSLKTRDEDEVLEYARCIARSMYHLPLMIRNVEYQFDRHQLTVFYEAQHHVDYREFVQNIHLTFKARVWMERVGGSQNHNNTQHNNNTHSNANNNSYHNNNINNNAYNNQY